MDERLIENHMVLPYADDETASRYLPEESDWHINGGPQDELDQRISDDAALATRLGMMIARISDKNSFPKDELIQTLKAARDRIDPTPAILRKQAG